MRIAVFFACVDALHPGLVGAAPSTSAPTRTASASPASAPTDSAATRPLRLRIAVGLDPAYDEEVTAAIRVVATDAAQAAGYIIAQQETAAELDANAGGPSAAGSPGGLGPRLGISLGWSDEAAGHIRVEYVLDGRGSGAAGPRTFVRRCQTCDATMLVEKVRKEIGPVLGFLEPLPPPVDTAVPVPAARPAEPARRPLSRLGWAGVGLSIAAAAPFAFGVAMVVRGEDFLGSSKRNSELLEYRDYRPAGAALLGAAAGLVVTGVALIVVDRVRARRSSRRAKRAHNTSRDSGLITVQARGQK